MPLKLLKGPALVTAAFLVASCAPSSPELSETQAVLDAYRQSWADVIAAGDPANPDAPELRVHRSGQALDIIVAVLTDYKAKGVVFRGKVELHPQILELDGGKSKIRDCVFDRTEALDPMTNQILKPAANHPIVATTTMQVIDGIWKAVNFAPLNEQCTPEPSTSAP